MRCFVARFENLRVLQEGVSAWNEWRAVNGSDLLDLSGADLASRRFPYVDGSVDDPYDAYLDGIILTRTNLEDAKIVDICVRNANFDEAVLTGADLTNSTFIGVSFRRANLERVILRGVKFVHSDLSEASLGHAIIEGATIDGVAFETVIPQQR